MSQLFYNGDFIAMGIITALLAAVFFAAWKAPAWVKDLGLIAMIMGFFGSMLGCYLAFGQLSEDVNNEIGRYQIYGGFQYSLIGPLYGMAVYVISIAIHIWQKPKI